MLPQANSYYSSITFRTQCSWQGGGHRRMEQSKEPRDRPQQTRPPELNKHPKLSMEESQNEHTLKVRPPTPDSVKCGLSVSQASAKERSMRLLDLAILSTAPLRSGLSEEFLDLMTG